MTYIDWIIAIIPLFFILSLALYSGKYVKGVVDYLAAGRLAGRYVICVDDMAAGLSVITLVAYVEMHYQTGFAMTFWSNMLTPLGIAMALTGYCVYRFRETRALSIGQFLEMRYNRPFRVFASGLRTLTEMLINAIGPVIAANFFIAFLGLPQKVSIAGFSIPSFLLVIATVLFLAVMVILPGGRISLLLTDSFQGLLSYPIFVLIVVYVLMTFSWKSEIVPVMLDRASGESFLNPFDIEKLRDFNVFALIVGVISTILNRANWIGNDTTSSGRTPHEQKMAGVLGAWRNGFSMLMCLVLAVMMITLMNHQNFAEEAHEIRQDLSKGASATSMVNAENKIKVDEEVSKIPVLRHKINEDEALSREKNLDTIYFDKVADTIADSPEGRLQLQKYKTLYNQTMLPVIFRRKLPVGMTGIFFLLMIMLLVSSDDSRIFNSASTIVQDVVLPFCKKAPTPKQHIAWLRLSSILVAVFFFCVSALFSQLDYINMFLVILQSLWFGGAGPVMIFGLYSRFGTTAGAFASVFCGAGVAGSGIILQQNWAQKVYPFLENMNWVEPIDKFLQAVSAPFNPIIIWKMDTVKFPINSYEMFFFSMLAGVSSYVIVSLITKKRPFNLDKMLHRGKYADEHTTIIKESWTLRNFFSKLIGITSDYTKGDRIIAWGVFFYSYVYNFGLCFLTVLIWNIISPWEKSWWGYYFLINSLIVAAVVGTISTIWFSIGGIRDGTRLFRDLGKRVNDPLDYGAVFKDEQNQDSENDSEK